MFHRPNLEVNVAEHCNLRCYGCDHDAPLSPPRLASLTQFAADLRVLAPVLRVDELRLLGGEPLLHPQLLDFIDVAHTAGISKKVVLVTNGVLLHRAPKALWTRLDRLWLSVYPGVVRRMTTAEVAAACAAHGVEFHADVIHHFFATLLNQPIEDRRLVQAIYRACKTPRAWSCHTIRDGRFYKCPTAALAPGRMARRRQPFVEGERDFVRIESANLERQLTDYLNSTEPLAACAWCLGSSGPPMPHRQMNRAGMAALDREDRQEVVAAVRQVLLGVQSGMGTAPTTQEIPITTVPAGSHATDRLTPPRLSRRLADVAQMNCWSLKLRHPWHAWRLAQSARRSKPGGQNGQPVRVASAPEPLGEHYRKVLTWLRSLAESVTDRPHVPAALAEVAGGLVRTLLDAGDRPLAVSLAHALCGAQRRDGSWPAPRGGTTLQATARATDGLSALPLTGEREDAIRRGCGWLSTRMATASTGGFLLRRALPRLASGANLLALRALRRGAECLNDPELRSAASLITERSGSRPASALSPGLGDFFFHAHSYPAVALLDLGRVEASVEWADAITATQRADGSLPRYRGRDSCCATCSALFAQVASRLGRLDPARRALGCLGAQLAPSGGLYGSYGPEADFSHDELDPQAAVAFIDAFHAFLSASFDAQVDRFEDSVLPGDNRVAFLLQAAGSLVGHKALDVGCGRGAVARALAETCPGAEIWGVDHSAAMLRHLPAGIPYRCGSMQNLPFADASFDVVYTVEALEHACNPEGAVRELCRVTRPGGRIVIIDKNAERAGALTIESWERWFGRDEVLAWLRPHCDEVRAEEIAIGDGHAADLFIGWCGRRTTEPLT